MRMNKWCNHATFNTEYNITCHLVKSSRFADVKPKCEHDRELLSDEPLSLVTILETDFELKCD